LGRVGDRLPVLLIKTQTQMSVRKKFNYGTRVVTGSQATSNKLRATVERLQGGRELNKLAGKYAT